MQIFLSHSHLDRAIAEALSTLLRDMFGERVHVEYSSDQTAGGGVPPGAHWLPWITTHIEGADRTYVLLTPNSFQKPWVLWESGAAAGVSLATQKERPVVPITFGLSDDDIPSPFVSAQCVRGDTREAGGIHRLLQDLNEELGSPLAETPFKLTLDGCVPGFFAGIKKALQDSAPIASLLASVPHGFPAKDLTGLWVTCYEFRSDNQARCHADVVELRAESARRLTGRNPTLPPPRTEAQVRPFRHELEAEVANRHLVGHWKNVSDRRYFGTLHLAVQTGENVMAGYYTCFEDDVTVLYGPWRWVRLDPATIAGVDLSRIALRAPREIGERLADYPAHAGPLALSQVIESS
jgi:hypothetical protein